MNYTPVGGMTGGASQGVPGQGGDVGKLLQDLSQLIDGQQNNAGGGNNVSQFLQDLAGVLGGQQGAQGAQGAQNPASPMGGQPGSMPLAGSATATPTGSATGSATGASASNGLGTAGQGMHDIKINSTAGGDALHLQEDSQGNLYNGSGNNVGHMGADGSVTLNSGATKEAAILETGHSNGKMSFMQMIRGGGTMPETGDGGNKVFDSSQVSVSSGDLNQKNDV
ncbi:hypothetical protein K788_0001246 (plasmid) [Paraburkholderia caribensis MBA4]|uniref:Uncharacterized protein n=1 Tax=Paraburkholderia caribensis MBA4 TaxID=1323664 RepID=A0A0P0RNA6_9BURK|nr:hypothetical protein K788_0001246 [Paraburkholderia caribensis MBA4]